LEPRALQTIYQTASNLAQKRTSKKATVCSSSFQGQNNQHFKSQPGSKNQKKQAPSSMHCIMAQFELNLSHAIQATPNKIVHAFFVPYDGHCLFQAFKSSLNIQTSVQDL
jgi:hypothetical protein